MKDNNLQPEGWEKEWDSAFNWEDRILPSETERWRIMYGFTPKELKEHVRSIIAAERTRCIKEIEGLKKIPVEIPHGSPYLSGYNEALDDAIKIIKNEK